MIQPFYTHKRFLMLIVILIVFIFNAVIVDFVIYSSPKDMNGEKMDPDFSSKAPDKTETEKEQDSKKDLETEKEKDPKKDSEDEKETPEKPFSESEGSRLLDKIEILGIIIDGKEKGQIDKSEPGIKIQPGKDYGVIRVEGEIKSVTIGDTVFEDWELTAIKPNYIVLEKAGEEIELGFYK